MAKNLCSRCFHSYVCEQFNEHRDSPAEYTRCHFYNDHFVDAADVEVVVRCGECARRYTELCALYAGQMNGKDYFIQQGDDFFCKKGRR